MIENLEDSLVNLLNEFVVESKKIEEQISRAILALKEKDIIIKKLEENKR